MNDHDYYEDLGLTEYATSAEIKSAFHALAKKHHPDKTGTNDATVFLRVRQAYNVLADPTSRAAYDRSYQRTRTRTAEYEAENTTREAEHERDQAPEQAATASYEEKLRRSPPPMKPTRTFAQSGTSYFLDQAYLAWEKRYAKHREHHPWYEQGYVFMGRSDILKIS